MAGLPHLVIYELSELLVESSAWLPFVIMRPGEGGKGVSPVVFSAVIASPEGKLNLPGASFDTRERERRERDQRKGREGGGRPSGMRLVLIAECRARLPLRPRLLRLPRACLACGLWLSRCYFCTIPSRHFSPLGNAIGVFQCGGGGCQAYTCRRTVCFVCCA